MSKLRADNARIATIVAAWSVVVVGPRRPETAGLSLPTTPLVARNVRNLVYGRRALD
ncbi:hypothetical protein N601_30255 [Rhodococcus erythropolis DN1]|nr:hypothetical protein N601_30255 [Rhodococcus erythropolis DN1]